MSDDVALTDSGDGGGSGREQWQVVLVGQGEQRQCVLYNRRDRSFAVSHPTPPSRTSEREPAASTSAVVSSSSSSTATGDADAPSPHRQRHRQRLNSGRRLGPAATCPLCRRPFKSRHAAYGYAQAPVYRPAPAALPPTKDGEYFSLLSEANSLANTPRTTATSHPDEHTTGQQDQDEEPLLDETLNTGYFDTFFRELELLGRGGGGSVLKVQHVMQGEKLGVYALKKVAVGDSAPSLLRILREVHLLEAVQHPNIVSYHHAWVENSKLSAYSPSVPTLHILMAYANGGSLDHFIDQRRGTASSPDHDDEGSTPSRLKEQFKMRKLGAVHLLRLDEILDLFEDIASGLAFLHARNILHLDLKAENVLLHWEEDALLPTAKLSDFGNATSDSFRRERMGGSGTLAYTAPEAWEYDPKTGRLRSADRAVDQWALGLILHLLSFFALPYHNEDDMKLLEEEIKSYPGFFPHDASLLDHGTRHDLPASLLRLMSKLVNRQATQRPSAEKVLTDLEHIRDEMLSALSVAASDINSKALIRSISPSAPEPATSAKSVIAPEVVTNPLEQSSSPITLQFARNRLLASILAVLKLALLDRVCQNGGLARWTLYAVLVTTIVDVAVADPRLTLVLAGVPSLMTLHKSRTACLI